MRILSYILAIWVLFINVIPCLDSTDKDVLGEETHLYAEASHNHNSDGAENDLCSPFCVCNCCHSYSLVVAFKTSFTPVSETEMANCYTSSSPQVQHFDIFHPPKQA